MNLENYNIKGKKNMANSKESDLDRLNLASDKYDFYIDWAMANLKTLKIMPKHEEIQSLFKSHLKKNNIDATGKPNIPSID